MNAGSDHRTASRLLRDWASRGRYHFSTEDVAAELGASLTATRSALRRLKKKGLVATPYRGFHVAVPPEYQRLGCLPAEQFVPQLMDRLEVPYYAGLLTAARYHGAAHQQPQSSQVEQDLVISRALVEIFADDQLARALAFRGGTALFKLHLTPAPRYSEDIDLVQTVAEPIGQTLDRLPLASTRGSVSRGAPSMKGG